MNSKKLEEYKILPAKVIRDTLIVLVKKQEDFEWKLKNMQETLYEWEESMKDGVKKK